MPISAYRDDYYVTRWKHGRQVALADRGWKNHLATSDVHKVEGGWNVAFGFPNIESAIEGALAFKKKHDVRVEVCVVLREEVVWSSKFPRKRLTPPSINPQEEQVALETINGPGDIDQPLHIPRQSLIDTLQSNLDKERAEREKAQQAITARRQAAQDAVGTLSSEELLNLVQKYVTQDLDDIVSFVEEAGKSGRLKSQPQAAGPKETALEKYVRVLGLANDDTIEVKPNNPIYPLL